MDVYYCDLAPCLAPNRASGADSYATLGDYLDHIEQAHFIAAINAPQPVIVHVRRRLRLWTDREQELSERAAKREGRETWLDWITR